MTVLTHSLPTAHANRSPLPYYLGAAADVLVGLELALFGPQVAQIAMPALDSLPLPPGLLAQSEDETQRFALPGSEPGYSAVAPHIAESLLGLLAELELPARHQPQGEALRQRVQGGLNWYELVPVLDDLAVLVLAVSDSGQREFAGYLKQLNERLAC